MHAKRFYGLPGRRTKTAVDVCVSVFRFLDESRTCTRSVWGNSEIKEYTKITTEDTIAEIINKLLDSVREYVFFVFFQISKNMTFYVFLKRLWKKSVAKILSSMMLTLLQKKKKSLLNVYRNFGLKTPDVVGTYRRLSHTMTQFSVA